MRGSQSERVIVLDLEQAGYKVVENGNRLSEILDRIGRDSVGSQVKSRFFRLQLATQEGDFPTARELAEDALKTMSLVVYPSSSEDTTDLGAAICHILKNAEVPAR